MTNDDNENPKPRGRRGDGTIYWDNTKHSYVGEISLGYYATGKRRREKVHGRTKTDVRRKLRDLRKELESGVRPDAYYTVADAISDWLARGLRGRSDETIAKNTSLATNHIVEPIGKARLRDLTADDVDDWLVSESAKLANRSLRDCLSILRRAIRLAQRREKVGRNVADLVTDLPEGREGRPSKALTFDQAQRVLEAAKGTRLHAYIVVCLMTGIRTEEARALTWDRVHLEPGEGVPPHVEVWRSVRRHGDTKTKKSRRTLALPPQAVDAFALHQIEQTRERQAAGRLWTNNDLVFCTQVGTPLDAANVRRGFNAVTKKAGIVERWTPRELRHSFVSLMSAEGVSIEDIARLVGHSSSATTEAVYRKELRPVITEGAEIMSSLFKTTNSRHDHE